MIIIYNVPAQCAVRTSFAFCIHESDADPALPSAFPGCFQYRDRPASLPASELLQTASPF